MFVTVALATSGCWEVIQYNPDSQADPPAPQKLTQTSEPQHDEPVDDGSPLPAPTASELFSEQPSDVPTTEVPATSPPESPVEPPTQSDPLWDASEREKFPEKVAQPAPPSDLDWLDDLSDEGEPETVQPEAEPPEIVAVPTPANPRTALAAWRMASKWSLAVGVYGKGLPADRYGNMWQQADFSAQLLGVQLSPLPENVAEDELLSTATTLLLKDSGPQLAKAVAVEHSAGHQALCDLAIKTHALLLIYTPNNSDLESLIRAIRQAAEDSPLPDQLWEPIVKSLDAGADFKDVKRAVFELHDQATRYLGDLVSP